VVEEECEVPLFVTKVAKEFEVYWQQRLRSIKSIGNAVLFCFIIDMPRQRYRHDTSQPPRIWKSPLDAIILSVARELYNQIILYIFFALVGGCTNASLRRHKLRRALSSTGDARKDPLSSAMEVTSLGHRPSRSSIDPAQVSMSPFY
jgi:hypothetical protein